MPLRDHFRSPLDDLTAWEGFHGGWPMVIVQHLSRTLPPRYVAAPRVHSGSYVEIDVAAYDTDDANEHEVRVYDARRGWGLVAVVEIVTQMLGFLSLSKTLHTNLTQPEAPPVPLSQTSA